VREQEIRTAAVSLNATAQTGYGSEYRKWGQSPIAQTTHTHTHRHTHTQSLIFSLGLSLLHTHTHTHSCWCCYFLFAGFPMDSRPAKVSNHHHGTQRCRIHATCKLPL